MSVQECSEDLHCLLSHWLISVDCHGSRLGYKSMCWRQTVWMIKYLLYKDSSKFTFLKVKRSCTLPLSRHIEVEQYRNYCEYWFVIEIFLTYTERRLKWLFVLFFFFEFQIICLNASKLSGFSLLSLVLNNEGTGYSNRVKWHFLFLRTTEVSQPLFWLNPIV